MSQTSRQVGNILCPTPDKQWYPDLVSAQAACADLDAEVYLCAGCYGYHVARSSSGRKGKGARQRNLEKRSRRFR